MNSTLMLLAHTGPAAQPEGWKDMTNAQRTDWVSERFDAGFFGRRRISQIAAEISKLPAECDGLAVTAFWAEHGVVVDGK
jgi:hypothetical protein